MVVKVVQVAIGCAVYTTWFKGCAGYIGHACFLYYMIIMVVQVALVVLHGCKGCNV